MPISKTIYDRKPDAGHPSEFVRDALTAQECVKNDPDRYSLRPWKAEAKVSAKDDARAKAAAKRGRADPFDHDGDGNPGGSLPKDAGEGEDA